MYTSRSAIECYNCVCRAKRYNQYLFENGIGLVSNFTDIALIFGTAIHISVELLFRGKLFEEALLPGKAYITDKFEKQEFIDRKSNNIQASYIEHLALLEALLYSYYLSEYEYIAKTYNVITVEQEFETYLTRSDKYNEDIILLSKVDAVLQDKETLDIHTYSLKTDKELYYQTQESHAYDLQSLTEIWATEQWGKRLIPYKQEIFNTMSQFADEKANTSIRTYLDKKYPTFSRVAAVRFCHLIKGKRWTNEDDSVVTLNPLIYGYRKPFFDNGVDNPPTHYAYAHSYSYQNQANKSGQGKLGKGWEKFSVWDKYPGGIQGWIDDICDGLIQPEEENPIVKHIVVPEPYYRDDSEVDEAISAIRYQELTVLEDSKNHLIPVTTLFPKNRKSCNYPVICEYKDFCYRPPINQRPLESGLYRYRRSHHKKEEEWQDIQLQLKKQVDSITSNQSLASEEEEFK